MLKFILSWHAKATQHLAFQNILCWSLSPSVFLQELFKGISKHLMLKFIFLEVRICSMYPNFKTSYVEVYLNSQPYNVYVSSFQNILCWSLSYGVVVIFRADQISKHLMLKFINYRLYMYINSVYFKTSYVEVYLRQEVLILFHRQHFKTSYVEVYLGKMEIDASEIPSFQNILCWSLSAYSTMLDEVYKHFKTSYVEVYRTLLICM